MQERYLTTVVKNAALALLVLAPILFVVMYMANEWSILLPIVVLLLLAPIISRDDQQALLIILVLRPMIDIFGERHLVEVGNIPLNLSSVVSIVVLIWAALRLLARRSAVWRQPLFWPLLVLVVFVVTTGSSVSQAASIREIVRFVSIILMFFMGYECLRTQDDLKRLTKVFVVSAALPILVAFYQFVSKSGLSFGELENRVYGTFGHPNVFAMYLMLVLAAVVGTWNLFGPVWRKRMVVGLGALVAALLLTYTRGAWLGSAIVLIAVGIVSHRRVLAWLALAGVALLVFGPAIQGFTFQTFNVDLARVPVLERVFDRSSDDSSIDWRVTLWKEMRHKIQESPVLGHGLGSFTLLRAQQVYSPFEGTEAHNDYLRLIVETGYLGIGAYVLLLLGLLGATFKRAWAARVSPQASLAAALAGLTLALVIMGSFENVLQATAVMWGFWVLLGAALRVGRTSAQ